MNPDAPEPLGVLDDPHYAALALERSEGYRGAAPFPHTIIDDFLPDELARAVARSFPVREDLAWIERDNTNNRRRFQHDETKLPKLIRETLRELNSRQMLLFLETLTGLDNLLPDPYFLGGGVHISEQGDFLNVHADFNWHHKLQAHRRCNALLYLSEDWQEDWGGALELWSQDMSERVVTTWPRFNRLVVFNVSDSCNHGVPEPSECPPGVLRKVLNLYYYTSHRDDEHAENLPHFTLYRTEASPQSVEIGEEYRAAHERDRG